MAFKLQLAVFALTALMPLTAAAQANCPTRSMLEGDGIKFQSGLSDEEIHRLAPNGTIIQDIDFGGDKSQNILAYGVHVLQLADIVDGKIDQGAVWRYVFDVDIAALPEPTPNGTWSAQSTQFFVNEPTPEVVKHRWGPLVQYSIGDCTLDAIHVSVSYDGREFDYTEEAMYFPNLGTAILTAYIGEDGREDYTYTSIGSP